MKILTKFSHKDRVRPKTDFTIKKDDKGNVLNKKSVSLTIQSERENVNINNIVAKAKKTGVLGSGLPAQRKERYGDFSSSEDFLSQQNKIVEFKTMFDNLPSDVRNRFNNNPAQLLDFVADPENKEEAIELGLLPKPEITKQIIEEDGKYFQILLKDGVEVERAPTQTPPPTETVTAPTEPTPEA
jgi:phage internal scaffolding protein